MNAAIFSCLEDTVSCRSFPTSGSYILFISNIRIFPESGFGGDIDVPLTGEYPVDMYSPQFDQFWVSALTTVHSIRSFSDDYWELYQPRVQRYVFRGQFDTI